MSTYLYIGFGGFLGALARYFLNGWMATLLGSTWPYGTLFINLSGSFLLGFLAVLFNTHTALSPALRLALTVGFLGAYTTFSTFSYEWVRLWLDGKFPLGLLYMLGSVGGGGIATVLGMWLGRLA